MSSHFIRNRLLEGWQGWRRERKFRLTPHPELQPHLKVNFRSRSRSPSIKQQTQTPSANHPSTTSSSPPKDLETSSTATQATTEPPTATMSAEHELRSLLDELH